MILEVNQLTSSKLVNFEEDVSFDAEKYKCTPPLLSVNSCHVKVEASSYDDFIIVRLFVSADLTLESSYTLKPFPYKLKTNEEYHFTSTSTEEDDDFILFKGNKIELDVYVFNLICASIPISPKAPGETLPSGGEGYRILKEEDYLKEKEKEVDHRFDKLDELDLD